MAEISPAFARVDKIEPASVMPVFGSKSVSLDVSTPLSSGVTNYYMTDPISRASVTMAKCTAVGPRSLVKIRGESSYATSYAAAASSSAASTATAAAGAASSGAGASSKARSSGASASL